MTSLYQVNEALEPDDPNEGPHPIAQTQIDAATAIERLKEGNKEFLDAQHNDSNISTDLVAHLFEHGQAPFAVVVTCADSRVVPEHIFMTGLGELFTIRVAGNVIGDMELASSVYATGHLGCKLILVLGHTHCGAIETAMEGEIPEGALAPLVESVANAIGEEQDPYAACKLNVLSSIEALTDDSEVARLMHENGLEVRGAIYHTHSGEVEFL